MPLRRLPALVVHVGPDYVPPVDFRNEHGICGADSHHKVLELDPRTGWVLPHWFCKRHFSRYLGVEGFLCSSKS